MSELTPVQQKIRQKINAVAAIANELPGVVIIHNKDLALEYLSPRGEATLGVQLEELKQMGLQYFETFFNPDDAEEYIPRIVNLLKQPNMQDDVTYFQQVRGRGETNWTWHISTSKVLLHDDAGQALLFITFSMPIDPRHHLTTKVTRLLEENSFLRNNYPRFASLGKREREVLRLLAMGKNSSEIAAELFISVATVETHRRNIKQKLDTSSLFGLMEYARAFDLI